MRILVACEESQTVTIAMRQLGYEAYSCDTLPTSGNHPEWHIQDDVMNVIHQASWQMMIAFPPCTNLTRAGAALWAAKRDDGRMAAAMAFVQALWDAPIPMIAIENPPGALNTGWRRPSQIIQPYQFGHDATKATCLWLKNLPPLMATGIVKPTIKRLGNGKTTSAWMYAIDTGTRPSERSKARSKTFPGIAVAMAKQWGHLT